MRTPSQQQGTIMKRVIETRDSILVQAAAGSGKTTTLEMIVAAINSMNPMYNVLYVVFNKGIQKEAKQKFGKKYYNLDILTTHGLGMKDCQRNAMEKISVDNSKVFRLMSKYEPNRTKQKDLRNIITFTLAADINIELYDAPAQIAAVAKFYGIRPSDDKYYHMARQVIADSREMRSIISYDDMIDQPLNVGMPPSSQYDFILVDEAQDLNNQQMRFISRYAHPATRYVCVGDKFQSVYGFRGANFDAMDTLKEYFNLVELPLSVCYRCATDIIDMARSITTTIEAAPKAVQGEIIYRSPADMGETYDELKNGDMVICRTNAPLVRVALSLLRQNKKPNFLGRDFGEGLAALVEKFCNTTDWEIFHDKFNTWCKGKLDKLFQLERTQEIEIFNDKIEALDVICEGLDSPMKIISKIKSIFAEAAYGGITLSTIHKAKGLEATKVIFLDYGNVPHPMAQKAANREHALRQETNLKYVAITRAKHTLIMQDWEKQ